MPVRAILEVVAHGEGGSAERKKDKEDKETGERPLPFLNQPFD